VTGPSARTRWLVHGVAAVLAVGGLAVQFAGPVAPAISPLPATQAGFDAAYLARAEAYRTPVYVALTVAALVRIALPAGVALTPAGRRLTGRIAARVGDQRPARGAAAVVTTVVIGTDLALFPLVFWAGFVHDGAFGLRSQGLAGWLYDWFVVRAPVWLGVAALTLAGYWLARRVPDLWAPLGGVAAGLAAGLVIFVSPLVFEPLLYDFQPLEQGPVRAEVEQLLERAGEDVDGIDVADASRRSSRQNAYISGFGASERVVLYDTLLQERTPAEIGVVVAHELAHKRNADVLRYAALSVSGSILAAYAVAAVVRHRTRRGSQRSSDDPAGAAVVLLTAVVLSAIALPVQSALSRRAEAAADFGSLQYTDSPAVFAQMQRGLTESNLHEPRPPAAVTWYWGTHPPAVARLAMARWWQQR
jgi:STE24 endopeptidase